MKLLILDPHPFFRAGSAAIVLISMMHVVQVWLLYCDPTAIYATNLTAILMASRFVRGASDIPGLQVVLCGSALLALFGVLFRVGWLRIVMFVPQHMVLGAMAWGGLLAATMNHYLDGTPMGWAHIAADQIGYIVLFGVHSSAIGRRCRDPNG